MAQHARPIGPTTNAAATFTSSMVDGSHPDRNRVLLGPRIPLPLAQTTHVAAAFTPDMVQGSHPDTSRAFIAPKQGWSISQTTHTDAPFTSSMVAGWQPQSPRLFKLKLGWTWSETTFAPPMTAEQFAGWHPDTGRLFLAPRIPQPLHQAAQHVQAPFSPEMVAGWRPDTGRIFARPRLGWQDAQLTFDVQMTAEQFAGWHPDQARLFLAPKIPQPLSQPTHVSAPFGIEMVRGWMPETPRLVLKAQLGWQNNQTTFDVPMTAEMFAGWHPDQARLFLGPRLPQPLSQPTHTAAPFSVEMVQGHRPDQARPHVLGKAGWQNSQTTFLVQMTAEMFAGWHPDTHRQRLAPRIPLPLSQTSHTSAPFSHEMVQGAQPARNRVTIGKQIVGWIQGLIDGLFGTQAVRPVGRTLAQSLRFRAVAEAAATVLPPYETAVLADGATYYWHLDEASGTYFFDVIDPVSGGGSHNLTLVDGTDVTFQVAGIRGGSAVQLGASHGRSRLLAFPTLVAPYSLEAWLIPGAGRTDSGEILGSAGSPPTGLFLETDGTIRFNPISGVSGSSVVTLPVGALAHLVVTVSAPVVGQYTIKFYVNGVVDAAATFTTTTVPSMFVAAAFNRSSPSGINTLVVDLIDEMAMYNGVELTAAQVAAHWTAGIGPTQSVDRLVTALSTRTTTNETSRTVQALTKRSVGDL